MAEFPAEYWPWIMILSLGLFHGVNPAMGWLFAVALGLHRHSQRIVFLSLIPIAIGHAAAVCVVVIAVLAFGVVVNAPALTKIAGLALLGFAAWHAAYGHSKRIRIGMQTGLVGLLLWSFLMATAHGAGLMLIPTLPPICSAAFTAKELTASSALPIALAVVGTHTGAMLAATAVAALVAYQWAGVAFLRRGWINLDFVWTVALAVCGILLLAA